MSTVADDPAAAILDSLLQRGFVVFADPDGGLHVQPRDQLSAADVAAITRHKAALLALLDREMAPVVYRLDLRPLASTVPVVVRLRRALKTLLRGFAFRCQRIEERRPE